MISLYERLRKNKVVVFHICAAKRPNGGEGEDHILEICAERLENLHPAETFHAYAVCSAHVPEAPDSSGIVPAEVPENVPPAEQAFRGFAAFAEGGILVGYDLSFTGKLLDRCAAEYGAVFTQERIDLQPIAKRLFYKKTNDYSLAGLDRFFGGNKECKTCAQYTEAVAELAHLLPYLQQSWHNYVPYFHIVVPRRKIRMEICNAKQAIAFNLMRCALFGKEHPLFPLWVYKCAEKLEYVSRFVDKKGERLPQDYYDSIFTAYNEAVWETKERLPRFKDEGEYTITDALCEKAFAIYDAVRVSCMPYLLNRMAEYRADDYASIIVQAVETEGKNSEIKVDYDHLDRKYSSW